MYTFVVTFVTPWLFGGFAESAGWAKSFLYLG